MKIPEDAKTVVDGAYNRHYPCTIATSSSDGVPNIGFKGSMIVYDEESLAYWERLKRTHLENLQNNPRIAIISWDGEKRTGYRFRGTAKIVTAGELRNKVWEMMVDGEKKMDPEMSGFAVIIKVEEILPMGKARQTFKLA